MTSSDLTNEERHEMYREASGNEAPAPKPKGRAVNKPAIITGIATFLITGLIFSAGEPEAKIVKVPGPERVVTETIEVEVPDVQVTQDLQSKIRRLEARLEDQKQAKPEQAPAPVAASFGAGVQVVGSDIEPGTYRSPGGSGCYWERLSNFSGGLGGIIANEVMVSNPVVTIAASDVGFSSSNCGTWTNL